MVLQSVKEKEIYAIGQLKAQGISEVTQEPGIKVLVPVPAPVQV
jgi:hypothetical protein